MYQIVNILFFISTFFLLTTISVAETKYFSQEVDQPFSGNQSPDDARIAALTKAKIEALEKAGTYLESLTIVENFMLKKDEITALAAGVLSTEIISQKNYATQKGFGIILVARIEVNNHILEEKIDKLMSDRTLLEKYNEIQRREKELLNIIQNLEKQNQMLRNDPNLLTVPEKKELGEKYNSTIKALSASDWNRKAISLWEKGTYTDPHQAIIYLNKSIQLDKDNPVAYNNLGTAFFNLNDLKSAIQNYDKAIQLDAVYTAAYNNRGVALYQKNENWKAIDDFNQAIELQPNRVSTYLYRGAAYKKLYQYQRALNDFSQVLQLEPEYTKNIDAQNSLLIGLNELERLCNNAKQACNLGLCKAMNYLKEKGFCKNRLPDA